MTIDRIAQLIVKGWRALGRATLRSLTYTLAPTRDVVLLKSMNDEDLRRWADQPAKQRAYSLARRWAAKTGRAILTEPRNTGRSK